MKKGISALLAVLMLSGMLVCSCTSKSDAVRSSDTSETSAAETAAAETTTSVFDTLPDMDFAGEAFTVYIPPNPDSPVDKGTFAESMTGETFNDAIYNRNAKVENQYNVVIKRIEGKDWGSTYNDMKPCVLAGDVPADVYFTHVMSGVANLISDGLLLEWTDIPDINFENPWWNRSVIKNLNIANKVFYTASSLSIQEPQILLFNKEMIANYKLESPYELVNSGKWTIDKLGDMASAAVADLNGDGKFTEEDDQFGLEYGIHWQIPALMYACDVTTVQMDDQGYPTIDLNSDKMLSVYDKITALLYDGNKTYCYDGNVEETANIPHIGIDSGRVLFCQWNLFSCEKLRETEVDYGVIPLPKYDEAQEKYVTNSWTGMYCLPVTISSDDQKNKIGILMEALSALGYTDVVPVYYNNVLSEKVSRDQDSIDMLSIILNGIVYDFGLNFSFSNAAGTFMSNVIYNKQNYESAYAKAEKSMLKAYDTYYNKVIDMLAGR